MSDEKRTFNPQNFITQVNGGDYLEVRWRLLWLRTEHPDAEIETEIVAQTGDYAMFRAVVRIPGGGCATGHGSEHAADFRDFAEKAETKAIGRALSALGFGTQFGIDWQEIESGSMSLADSPIGGSYQGGGAVPATDKQLGFLRSLAGRFKWEQAELDQWIRNEGHDPENLSKRDASTLIDKLQKDAPEEGVAPAKAAPKKTKATGEAPSADWTAFWRWARDAGYGDAKAIEATTGMRPGAPGVDPAAVRAALEQAGPPALPPAKQSKAARKSPMEASADEFDDVPF